MTDRCEPSKHLRGVDGWHWLTLFGHAQPAPYRWQTDGPGLWVGIERHGCTADWAYDRGHRYIGPALTPAEVEALRAERDALLAGRLDFEVLCSETTDKAIAAFARVHDENSTLRAENKRLREALVGVVSADNPHIARHVARAALEETK